MPTELKALIESSSIPTKLVMLAAAAVLVRLLLAAALRAIQDSRHGTD